MAAHKNWLATGEIVYPNLFFIFDIIIIKNEEKLPSHKIPTDTPPDNGLNYQTDTTYIQKHYRRYISTKNILIRGERDESSTVF